MVTSLHGLEAVKVDVNDATTGVLDGTGMLRLGLQNDQGAVATDGRVYPDFLSLIGQKISAQFDSLHLAIALAFVGYTGLRVSATGGMKTGLTFYLKQQKEGGSRLTGNNHTTYNIKEGILVPRRLVVPHGGNGKLEMEALGTWDAENDPLIQATGIALPTPNTPERFGLGPISLDLDGSVTPFTHVKSLEVNFGHDAQTEGSDGDYWDKFSRIAETMTRITLRGVDKSWLSAAKIPLTGAKVDHAGTTIVLRKRDLGGTFVAADVAEHILLTAAGMGIIETPWDVAGNAPGETTLAIPLYFDGTTAPLTMDLTYAYE